MSLNSLLVDLASGGSPWKQAVRVSSITNITLSGLQTIDGVALAIGDPVGVFGQTNPAYNGIYVASETAWVRRGDFDRAEYVQVGTCLLVLEGTLRTGHLFRLSSPVSGEIRVNVTNLVFSDLGGFGGGAMVATSLTGSVDPFPVGDLSRDIRVIGDEVKLVSSTVEVCDSAGVAYCQFEASSTLRVLDTATAFNLLWNQRAAGAGKATLIEGQKGQAGFIGGAVTVRAGRGGTLGTNLAGGVRVDLGQQVGGTTDRFTVAEMGTDFLSFRRIGTQSYIEPMAPTTDVLISGTSVGFTATATGLFSATNNYFSQNTIYWRDFANVIRRTDTVAANSVENIPSGATLDRQYNGSSRVYIDADGARINGNLRYQAVITPAAIGTAQNPYNPANLLTSRRVQQDVSAACVIQTITAGVDGQRITLRNHSATPANTLTLLHDDTVTGTANNRIRCPNNANLVIRCQGAVELEYSGAISRWTVIAP